LEGCAAAREACASTKEGLRQQQAGLRHGLLLLMLHSCKLAK
jgi:hypothetical protein